MVENQDFNLYFNLFFFGVIGLGMLIGFLRGFKKTTYSFITKLIFYSIFFVTLNVMVNLIWTVQLPFLSLLFEALGSEYQNVGSLSEALPIFIEFTLGDGFNGSLQNENFLEFATSLSLFVVKIVYAIFYFTVFNLFYRFIAFVIRIIFFRTKKEDKHKPKKRLPAMVMGGASGVLSVFVTIILLGGVMDVSQNFVKLLNEEDTTQQVAYYSGVELSDNEDPLAEVSNELELLRDMTTAYHDNFVVSTLMRVTFTDSESGRETPLNLSLFDRVFSIDYKEYNIRFRHEIAMVSDLADVFLSSAFANTQNISDLEGEDLKTAVSHLATSDLLVATLPLAIELGTEYMDVDMGMSEEELYGIDWRNEVNQMGVVAASMIEILNTAGVFDDEIGYEAAEFNGKDIESMFDAMSETEVFTSPAIMNMALAQLGDDFTMYINVPEDMDWRLEFQAFGRILGSIANTNLTIRDIQDQDFNVIFSKLIHLDLEIILDSVLLEGAMINALSSDSDLLGFDELIVPDDVVWRDEDGVDGELRIILKSFNAITEDLAEKDVDDFGINTLLNLSESVFDSVLESKVFSASFGNLVYGLSDDVEALVIPLSTTKTVLVNEASITIVGETELKAIISSLQIFNVDDIDDFNLDASFIETIDIDKIEEIFDSLIIHASLSKVMLDLTEEEGSVITIPHYDVDDNVVRLYDVDDDLNYIHVDELTNLINVIVDLGLSDDLDNLQNISIENINENIDTILGSAILHATISFQLIDLGDDMVFIPSHSAEEVVVQTTSGSNETLSDFIAKDELEALLKALQMIGIDDVGSFEGDINMDILSDEEAVDALLNSAIIHANLSKQLLDTLENDNVLKIPYYDEEGTIEIRLFVEGTDFILADELRNMLNGISALGLTDNFDSFDGNLDLLLLQEASVRETVLSSSILHATISSQILDQHASALIDIPKYQYNDMTFDTSLINTVGDATEETDTQYILKAEVDAFLLGVITLLNDGQSDTLYVDEFDGNLDLMRLKEQNARENVLSSSILHSTISSQIVDLENDDVIVVPTYEFTTNTLETELLYVVDDYTESMDNYYFIHSELHNLLEGIITLLEDETSETILVNDFTGSFNLENLNTAANQEKVLSSTILHATISKTVLDLDDGVLLVPTYMIDDETPLTIDNDSIEYISASEVQALINGLIAMNYTDLDSFGTEIPSDAFFDNRALLLESSSIHATISQRLLNDTNDNLLIPDENKEGDPLRIMVDNNAFTYLENDELNYIFDALEMLDLKDFGTLAFEASDILDNVNYGELLNSVSMQLTVSDLILPNTIDETALPNTTMRLVVTSKHYETILKDAQSESMIETQELINLLEALELLGADFDGNMDAQAISNSLNDMENILVSESMHLTIHSMIETNNNLLIPDLATKDDTFNMVDDVLTAEEIEAFIIAADRFATASGSGDDFTNIEFTFSAMESLDANDRDVILSSMVVRNTLTEELESIPIFTFEDTDYENDDPATFLRKETIQDVIENPGDYSSL